MKSREVVQLVPRNALRVCELCRADSAGVDHLLAAAVGAPDWGSPTHPGHRVDVACPSPAGAKDLRHSRSGRLRRPRSWLRYSRGGLAWGDAAAWRERRGL